MSLPIQIEPGANKGHFSALESHGIETKATGGTSFAAHLDQATKSDSRPTSSLPKAPAQNLHNYSPVPQRATAKAVATDAHRVAAKASRSEARQGTTERNSGHDDKTRKPTAQSDRSPAAGDKASRTSNQIADTRNNVKTSAQPAGRKPSGNAEPKETSKSTQDASSAAAGASDSTPGPATSDARLALLQEAQSLSQAAPVQPATSAASAGIAPETNPADATPLSQNETVAANMAPNLLQTSSTSIPVTASPADPFSGPVNSQDRQPSDQATPTDLSAVSVDESAATDAKDPARNADTPEAGLPANFAASMNGHTPSPTGPTVADPKEPVHTPIPDPSDLTKTAKPAQTAASPAANLAPKESGKPVKPTLESSQGSSAGTASKSESEPSAPELFQVFASVDTATSRESSPKFSLQPNAMPAVSPGLSNPVQADSTSPSPVPAVFVSDASADDSRAANFDKRHEEGSPAETLISPATTPSAVSDVAPTAVHAAAPVVLQPNPGFESAPGKTPASLPQQPASVAHEKAFAAWQSASDQVGRIVNSAALNSLRNGTEMRVQLRTDAYGPMEIRATLDAGKVGAAIGVENAQAHHALLNQLPALQQSLSERQVQVDHISVVNSFAQNGSDVGAGSGKQHDDAPASGASPQQPWGSERASEPASLPATEVRQPESLWGRLNVRA